MDIFENVPAPTDDELEEFDAVARQGAIHGAQARLIIPRLIQEIRRLRKLDALVLEREQLREERPTRPEKIQLDAYRDGLAALKRNVH